MNTRRGADLIARAAWVPVTVVVAAGLTWVMTALLPGDAATRILGANATPERLAELRIRLGLDRPPLEQFSEWVTGAVRGDLGSSALTGEPITELALYRLGNSLVLAGFAATVALLCGLGIGVFIGRLRSGRTPGNAILIAVSAVPDFVIGSIAVGVFAVSWRVLPSLSLIPPGQNAFTRPLILVIPVVAMALPVAAWIARYTAAAVARHAQAAHVRAARFNGVSEGRILVHHLLPAALAPLVQLFGWLSALLVGSTVVVEQLVGYPGIGSLLVEAVGNRDLTLVTAIVTVLAAIVAIVVFACDVFATRIDLRMTER